MTLSDGDKMATEILRAKPVQRPGESRPTYPEQVLVRGMLAQSYDWMYKDILVEGYTHPALEIRDVLSLSSRIHEYHWRI